MRCFAGGAFKRGINECVPRADAMIATKMTADATRPICPKPATLNMPLLIAAPGLTKGGENSTKPVELLDLYPTLADLCGLTPPANLEGASLRPLLTDPDSSIWTKPAVTQVWHNRKAWGYSLRTERWRYTEWLEGKAGRELYDHKNDGGEITNLASFPEHSELVAKLSNQLKPFVKLTAAKRPKK